MKQLSIRALGGRLMARLIAAIVILSGLLASPAHAALDLGGTITFMKKDPIRPLLYCVVQENAETKDCHLAIIDVQTEDVATTLPLIPDINSMVIARDGARLYASDIWSTNALVLDLSTQTFAAPLPIGPRARLVDTLPDGSLLVDQDGALNRLGPSGSLLDQVMSIASDLGVASVDGKHYFAQNLSLPDFLYKVDLGSHDTVVFAQGHGYTPSAQVCLSGDGSRVFWDRRAFDPNLNPLTIFDSGILAASARGALVATADHLLNAISGRPVFDFDTPCTIGIFDDARARFYYASDHSVVFVHLDTSIPRPTTPAIPTPADGALVMPLPTQLSWSDTIWALNNLVFFGTNRDAVASAEFTTDTTFVGQTADPSLPISWTIVPNQVYYWRVDRIGLNETLRGSVWSFNTSSLQASPSSVHLRGVVGLCASETTVTLKGAEQGWSISGRPDWLDISPTSGTASAVHLRARHAGLAAGDYATTLTFSFGSAHFYLPVTLTMSNLNVIKMLSDPDRPVVYALHTEPTADKEGNLLFIDAHTGQVESCLPIGPNPTDLTLDTVRQRLYVTNDGHPWTHVVDPATRSELAPLWLGSNVRTLNAAPGGMLYLETGTSDSTFYRADPFTGSPEPIYHLPTPSDGETDPTGRYYYHCDVGTSSSRVWRFDLAGGGFLPNAGSYGFPNGEPRLLLSADGSRVFHCYYNNGHRTHLYDADLHILESYAGYPQATTNHGELLCTADTLINTTASTTLFTFPSPSTSAAFSSDQRTLIRALPGTLQVVDLGTSLSLTATEPQPGPADDALIQLPLSQLSWTTQKAALTYRVYFGTDQAAVASATGTTAPTFIAETSDGYFPPPPPLKPGATYFWRVDQVGLYETLKGKVWSFRVAFPIVFPTSVKLKGILGRGGTTEEIQLTGPMDPPAGSGNRWEATADAPWLTITPTSGTTPAVIRISADYLHLPVGHLESTIHLRGDADAFDLPVSLDISRLHLVQMLTDRERPYIYALHTETTGSLDGILLIVNSATGAIEDYLSVGPNPTDMTIYYPKGRLYINNWREEQAHVVDLNTRELLPTLPIAYDAYSLNADRNGHVIYETHSGSGIYAVDVNNGVLTQLVPYPSGAGDGEIDPTGRIYYHADPNSTPSRIRMYDLTENPVGFVRESTDFPLDAPGPLIVSPDGSRIFFSGRVFDADLNLLAILGDPTSPSAMTALTALPAANRSIQAVSQHGEYAICADRLVETATGSTLYRFENSSSSAAISSDQKTLLRGESGTITTCPMSVLTRPLEQTDAIRATNLHGWRFNPDASSVSLDWTSDPVRSGTAVRLELWQDGRYVSLLNTAWDPSAAGHIEIDLPAGLDLTKASLRLASSWDQQLWIETPPLAQIPLADAIETEFLGMQPDTTGQIAYQFRTTIHRPDRVGTACRIDLLGSDGTRRFLEYLPEADPTVARISDLKPGVTYTVHVASTYAPEIWSDLPAFSQGKAAIAARNWQAYE